MIHLVFCFVRCNSWSPDVVRVRELRGCNKSLSWGADPRSSCWRHRIAPRLRAACPQMYPLEPTILSVLWMVDACGCEAFESGRSRSISRTVLPVVGRQGTAACGSGAERQEMLFIDSWNCISLSLFLGNGKWKGWNESCLLMICLEKR